jgi:site-specific DNA-cytosine methylase
VSVPQKRERKIVISYKSSSFQKHYFSLALAKEYSKLIAAKEITKSIKKNSKN